MSSSANFVTAAQDAAETIVYVSRAVSGAPPHQAGDLADGLIHVTEVAQRLARTCRGLASLLDTTAHGQNPNGQDPAVIECARELAAQLREAGNGGAAGAQALTQAAQTAHDLRRMTHRTDFSF